MVDLPTGCALLVRRLPTRDRDFPNSSSGYIFWPIEFLQQFPWWSLHYREERYLSQSTPSILHCPGFPCQKRLCVYLVAPGPLNIYTNSSTPPAKTNIYLYILLSPLPPAPPPPPPPPAPPYPGHRCFISALTRIPFSSSTRSLSPHVYHNECRHHHSHYFEHINMRRPAATLPFVSAPLLASRISRTHQSPCTTPLFMSRMRVLAPCPARPLLNESKGR